MLRSRMFTPGFKLFFGLSAFLLAGAFLFSASSLLQAPGRTVHENYDAMGPMELITGPLTVGWKGAVGNHFGYTILLAGSVLAAFLAFTLIAFRDADPEAEAELLQVETVPLTRAPAGANFAPLVGAFSLGTIAVGWVINTTMFYAGIVLLAGTVVTWTVRSWAERATGDDEVNFLIYHRIIDPLRVPIVGTLAVGFVVVGLSRLILAAPDKNTSSAIFGGAALVFFGGVLAVFLMPKIARPLSIALLVLGAIAVLGGGIYGVWKGERPIEHHGEVPHEGTGGTGGAGTGHSGETPANETPANEAPASGTNHEGLAPVGGTVTGS